MRRSVRVATAFTPKSCFLLLRSGGANLLPYQVKPGPVTVEHPGVECVAI